MRVDLRTGNGQMARGWLSNSPARSMRIKNLPIQHRKKLSTVIHKIKIKINLVVFRTRFSLLKCLRLHLMLIMNHVSLNIFHYSPERKRITCGSSYSFFLFLKLLLFWNFHCFLFIVFVRSISGVLTWHCFPCWLPSMGIRRAKW